MRQRPRKSLYNVAEGSHTGNRHCCGRKITRAGNQITPRERPKEGERNRETVRISHEDRKGRAGVVKRYFWREGGT